MANTTHTLDNPHEPSKPFTVITLAHLTKLLPTTYLPWRIQVEALLDGHGLLHFVDGSTKAPEELLSVPAPTNSTTTTATSTPSPAAKPTPNPAYLTWRRQDRLLYGALFSSLSTEVASLVSQTKTSIDLWQLLQNTYAKPSRSHLKHLKDRLRNASKGTASITAYLHSLKITADLLASMGSPVSIEDFTDYALRGLDDDYRPVIDGINARDLISKVSL